MYNSTDLEFLRVIRSDYLLETDNKLNRLRVIFLANVLSFVVWWAWSYVDRSLCCRHPAPPELPPAAFAQTNETTCAVPE